VIRLKESYLLEPLVINVLPGCIAAAIANIINPVCQMIVGCLELNILLTEKPSISARNTICLGYLPRKKRILNPSQKSSLANNSKRQKRIQILKKNLKTYSKVDSK
jgi:hypothetical protein